MSEDRDPAEGETPSDSYNASDPAQVKARGRSATIRASQRKAFFGRLVETELARKHCWEILTDLNTFTAKFGVAGAANCPEATAHYAGEREAGLRLFRMLLREQPELAAKMIAENDRG